jgi:ABC-type multidrug transport system ATPase subunit
LFFADCRLNGSLLTKRTFVKESGYVTSDDLLPPELSCIEMLRFAAKLRLPHSYSEAQREARVSASDYRAFSRDLTANHAFVIPEFVNSSS